MNISLARNFYKNCLFIQLMNFFKCKYAKLISREEYLLRKEIKRNFVYESVSEYTF